MVYRLNQRESMQEKVSGKSGLHQVITRLLLWGMEKEELMTDGNYEARRGLRDLPQVPRPKTRHLLAGLGVFMMGNALVTDSPVSENVSYDTTDRLIETRREVLGYDSPVKEELIYIDVEYDEVKDFALEQRARILGINSGLMGEGGSRQYFRNTLGPDSWGQTSTNYE